jgi:hypothetical protein
MPKVAEGKQFVVMALHLGEMRPSNARKIWFPFVEGEIRLPDFHPTARSISSDDFDLILPASEPIGDLCDLTRHTVSEYLHLRSRYFTLLSTILDHSWLLNSHVYSQEQSRVAQEMDEVLPQINERALKPYYDVAGKELYEWQSFHRAQLR